MPKSLGGPGPVKVWVVRGQSLSFGRIYDTSRPICLGRTQRIILHFDEASTSVHDLLFFIFELARTRRVTGPGAVLLLLSQF
jgi:hypothetical protein